MTHTFHRPDLHMRVMLKRLARKLMEEKHGRLDAELLCIICP